MRKPGRWVAIGVALLCATAVADPNDFKVYQLGNPSAASSDANAKFRVFARELGAALTSASLMPAETLGHAAFSVTAELSLVDFKSQDFQLPTERAFTGPLLIPSVHFRKGLPFSFELGARAAWIDRSRMGAGTMEVKWAVNEGFAFLPDLCARGFGTRLLNSRDFDLTVAGLDLGIGKQFAVGGMITLTPYAGWNHVWVSASSNNVDFNPGRTNAEAIASKSAQLQDTNVFDELSMSANTHNRFYGGLRFIGGVLQIGAEVSYSVLGKFTDKGGKEWNMAPVATYNFTLGLDF
ncbi:MAG: hypothetical protein HYZ28_20840 [Myxococcales bacterium]|nr:hypothetical protein [Myxococcales bacterium]